MTLRRRLHPRSTDLSSLELEDGPRGAAAGAGPSPPSGPGAGSAMRASRGPRPPRSAAGSPSLARVPRSHPAERGGARRLPVRRDRRGPPAQAHPYRRRVHPRGLEVNRSSTADDLSPSSSVWWPNEGRPRACTWTTEPSWWRGHFGTGTGSGDGDPPHRAGQPMAAASRIGRRPGPRRASPHRGVRSLARGQDRGRCLTDGAQYRSAALIARGRYPGRVRQPTPCSQRLERRKRPPHSDQKCNPDGARPVPSVTGASAPVTPQFVPARPRNRGSAAGRPDWRGFWVTAPE